MTKYIVLRRHASTESELWEPIGSVLASSPRRAIAVQVQQEEGQYAAVPERSWRPTPVTVETKTVVKLG